MKQDLLFTYGGSTYDAVQRLLEEPAGGIIITGRQGLGKYQLARRMAEDILNTQSLDSHPDFVEIRSEDNVIKMESLEPLRKSIGLKATEGDKKVFIIDDANLMTVSAQNSMLKILEDRNESIVIILVSHSDLLPTIHSRCMDIRLYQNTTDRIREYLLQNGYKVDELALSLADGCIGSYFRVCEQKDYLIAIKNFFSVFSSHSTKDMLIALSLMKEKDPNNFFEKYYKKYGISDIRRFMRLIGEVLHEIVLRGYNAKRTLYNEFFDFEKAAEHFTSLECAAFADVLNEHLLRTERKGAYAKTDFFDLIRHI